MITIKTMLLIGHVIGTALGVGGATMSDVLFLASVSDRRIDQSELKLLKIASRVVVAGLLLLTITGGGFFLTGSLPGDRFWAKFTIVIVASVNGYVMHRFLFPLFEDCQQRQLNLLSPEITRHLPLIVTAGSLSAVSWYTALVLGMWRSLTASWSQIILCYLIIALVTILVSNVGVRWLLDGCRKFWPEGGFGASGSESPVQTASASGVVGGAVRLHESVWFRD